MFIPGGGSRGWEELSREAGRADVARFAVRPLGVVGASEVFDDHPSLGAGTELFPMPTIQNGGGGGS